MFDALPEQWRRRQLSELIESLEAGVSVNSDGRRAVAGEYGILKTSSVSNGIFNHQQNKAVLNGERLRVRVSVRANSIILSRMNTLDLVGANAFVDRDYPDLFLPDRLWLLRTSKDADCLWLSFYMQSSAFRSQIADIATGTSGSMKNISKVRLCALPIETPPLDEQRRIAEVLRSIDNAASASQRAVEQAEECLSQQLSAFMQGNLRPPGTVGGGIPPSWRVGRCDSFFLLQRGFDITEKQASPGPYQVISSSGPAYLHAESAVSGPAVITGRKGRLGMVFYSHDPCWPHDTTLWVKDFKGNFPRFIYWKLRDMNLAAYDAATSVPTLNRNNVHDLTISLPPVDEQIEIAEVLDATSEAVEAQQKHLNTLLLTKANMASDLLSGRVRVPA